VSRRGWAPRALLAAATVPVGLLAGLGLSVGATALERPGLGAVGVLVAGLPGLFHAYRSKVLEGELRDALAVRPAGVETVAETVPAAAAVPAAEPERASEPAPAPVAEPEPVPAVRFGLVDARIDTGELQRIWDLPSEPHAGSSAPPVVTVAEPRVLVELGAVAGGRPRAGTVEARVYDALAHAEADELTRALELPARRGRHAAPLPIDSPMRHSHRDEVAEARTREALRRGRHVA
jgi:hypothetical protein